ncbi:hypothetical protein ACHAXT_007801 [Thalassiosira profunda]
MQAFVLRDSDPARPNPLDNGALVSDHPVPSIPSPAYALIRVTRAGICNTDLEILQGYMGFAGVLGHEFVGVVAALHDDATEDAKSQWLGKRVCGDINLGCCNNANSTECGVCDDSLGYDGRHPKMSRNHCPESDEYMLLPLRNLHLVPDSIPDEIAVFAEPLAAACRVVEQGLVTFRYSDKGASARGGDRVAILGDGKLGLCVAEILGREYIRCCRNIGEEKPPTPILFGKHQSKLDLVEESGVETRMVSTCYADDKQEQISPDHMNHYDVVIDATGNPNGLTLAMSLCRPMGTLSKAFHSAPIVIDELAVVGSRCGPIDVALELLEKNTTGTADCPPLRMQKYITKTFPLSEAREALEFAALKSTMKVQLVMTEKS